MNATSTTAQRADLADGIYFGLSAEIYHRDRALGSSNIRALLRSAPDFYWSSWMNPMRPKDDGDTPARIRGRALHTIVLDGEKPFLETYKRRPDDPEGASSSDKSAVTKAFNKACAAEGKWPLHGDAYDRAMITNAMIRKNPELAKAFDGGQPEVSVFWTNRAGIRLKCRFDYLRPRGIGDLKSTTNVLGKDFVKNCRDAIASYRYDVQAAHYMEGRAALPLLARKSLVFDGDGLLLTDKDSKDLTNTALLEWLKIVANSKEFAFVFVFYQADDAPITWSCSLSPGNPIIEIANRAREIALDRYTAFMQKFGTDTIWVLSEPTAELDVNDLPGYYGR